MVGMLLGKQNPRLQLSGCANARRLDTGIVALSGKFPLDEYVMWGFSARRDLLAPHLDVASLFAFFLDRSESSSGINLRLRAQPPRKNSRHNF